MKLQSLKCLCEIVASDFNLSLAARRLCASQPAVTRQIQMLEQELRFKVLVRHGNRITGLTRQGQTVHEAACRIAREIGQLKLLGNELPDSRGGNLVIATTHFHARYTLLPAIQKFRALHPKVGISIISGDPDSVMQTVSSGQADFGLSVESRGGRPKLVSFPCYEIRRIVIVPKSHPLTRARRLSLKLLARYPLIVYDKRFSSGRKVLAAFESNGIEANVVLSAIDAEVLKAYVAAGLGIAVVQQLAYDPRRDFDIDGIDAGSLFEPSMSVVTLRSDSPLRAVTAEFLRALAPKLDLSLPAVATAA